MAPTDQKTEIVSPAEVPEDLPLPSDPKVIFLGGLFVLALLAAAYIASEIILPFVFAIVLKLLLQPAFRILERLHVPQIIAALLLILALFGAVVGLGAAISSPARTWAAKLPEGIPRLQEQLNFLREPVDTLQRFLQQVQDFGAGPLPTVAASAQGPTLLSKLFTGTRNFASGFFTTVLFLFFLLVYGDIFLHRLVEILPRFKSKRQVVEISQQNRKRHLRISGHDNDHERGGWDSYGIGDVVHGSGRPDPLGDGGLFAELCADPRHCFRRVDLFARWPVDSRHTLASATSGGALFRIPSDRGRDCNADASGQTVHP